MTPEEMKRIERIIALRAQEAYFIRCNQYVKIGASKDVYKRVKQIQKGLGSLLTPPGLEVASAELVATEPGYFEREKELHAKFAHLRETGEWFREEPELTAYIESLQGKAAA